MTLTKDELEYFQAKLEDQLDALLQEAGKTREEMTDTEINGAFPDPNDRATLESDRGLELRIRDRERKLISKIQKALEKIAEGTYGECEVCGEPIGFKRLDARPVTEHCIECKKSAEEEERLRKMG